MRSRLAVAVFGMVSAVPLLAQDMPLPGGSVNFTVPKDSPVALIGIQYGESRATARGAALVLDLHVSAMLRNVSPNRIHGIALRVVSQEVTLGGKASVSMPSLNIGPGETFPVRIDRQLIRPTQVAGGPLVEVNLDGVLFADFSFYGPDRMNSRRSMTAWEKEAQRDREHFKRVLAQSGRDGLKREMLSSMARQAATPQLEVRLQRAPAVTSAAVANGERPEKFAFLQFPDSPVQPMEGWAMISGNEARAPRVQVRNRSDKAVKYVELGWLVKDQGGTEYMAASLPAAAPDLFLPAGKTAQVVQDTALRFARGGKPMNVQSMTGFVSQVEFADGTMWVPSRQNLETGDLQKTLPPSVEEQRLTELYRHKGVDALIEELKKY